MEWNLGASSNTDLRVAYIIKQEQNFKLCHDLFTSTVLEIEMAKKIYCLGTV